MESFSELSLLVMYIATFSQWRIMATPNMNNK